MNRTSLTNEMRRGRLHEATGSAAIAMLLVVAGEIGTRVLLVGERRDVGILDAHGLAHLIDPARLIVVTPRDRNAVLWSIEASLRSGATDAVIGVLDRGADLTESRRMMLAGEAGGATGLLCAARPASSCAAETRWRATYAAVETFESSRIVCELYRNKRGTSGAVYDVTIERQASDGGLAAALAARSAGPRGPAGR